MDYTWDFSVLITYKSALINGLLLTIGLTLTSVIFGSVLGIVFALARLSPSNLLKYFAGIYIEIIRAIPLLVLLVWAYYCLPIIGIKMTALEVAFICMSINLSAFVAETVRGGVEAIPIGYLESARALGMSRWHAMRRIILPQALRDTMPSLVNLYITLLKLSSLLSVIAVPELLHSANSAISQSYRPMEIYTGVAILYLIVVIPLSLLSRRFESQSLLRSKYKQEHA